jgi:hypothetical protein
LAFDVDLVKSGSVGMHDPSRAAHLRSQAAENTISFPCGDESAVQPSPEYERVEEFARA